jgi:hypothetical protein
MKPKPDEFGGGQFFPFLNNPVFCDKKGKARFFLHSHASENPEWNRLLGYQSHRKNFNKTTFTSITLLLSLGVMDGV